MPLLSASRACRHPYTHPSMLSGLCSRGVATRAAVQAFRAAAAGGTPLRAGGSASTPSSSSVSMARYMRLAASEAAPSACAARSAPPRSVLSLAARAGHRLQALQAHGSSRHSSSRRLVATHAMPTQPSGSFNAVGSSDGKAAAAPRLPSLSLPTAAGRGPPSPAQALLARGGANSGGGGGRGSSVKRYSSGSGDSGSGGGGSGGLWGVYTDLLAKHPLLVKAVTTAVLSAVGNLICQFLVEGKDELDWRRFNTFTALGFVWVAPCLHFWFGTLNRLVSQPGNTGALLRMACDQLGFAPLFISSMIGILAALEGKTLDAAAGVIRRDLPDAIRANWALWVPAQFLNFRFVPASYQVLFANMVALVWNVYFSFATRPKTA